MVRFPVLKCDYANNGTSLDFDSKYDCPVFIMVFKANNPTINSIGNMHKQYIKQYYFFNLKCFCWTIFHKFSIVMLWKN